MESKGREEAVVQAEVNMESTFLDTIMSGFRSLQGCTQSHLEFVKADHADACLVLLALLV